MTASNLVQQSGRAFPPVPTEHLETGPFIDGAKTPQQIPDDVAYWMFFQMIRSTDQSALGQRRHRSYIAHVLRSSGRDPNLADVGLLLAFAATVGRRLDAANGATTEPGERASLANEIRGSMPAHIGVELATAIGAYVEGHFKRTTKIIF